MVKFLMHLNRNDNPETCVAEFGTWLKELGINDAKLQYFGDELNVVKVEISQGLTIDQWSILRANHRIPVIYADRGSVAITLD